MNREITIIKHSSGINVITFPPLKRKDRMTDAQWAKYRDYYLKKTYKITLKDYNQMFIQQEGCCAICGRHQLDIKRIFSVDHDHQTDKVRGLLCSGCNFGLGYFEKYKEEMESYLDAQK